MGNLIGFQDFNAARIPLILYINLCLLTMVWGWRHVYFESGTRRGREEAVLMMLMLIGVFLAKLGVDALISNNCTGLTSSSGRNSGLVRLAVELLSEMHLCRPLALIAIALAGWMALVSWRGLRKR